MKDQGICCFGLPAERKGFVQLIVDGKEFFRVSENMVCHMLVDGNDIGQDCSFKNAAAIISEADDHNRIFITAQRPGTPVLSGTAIIAVEKSDIS